MLKSPPPETLKARTQEKSIDKTVLHFAAQVKRADVCHPIAQTVQLNLLTLLDKELESAPLRIEIVAARATVDNGVRFWLIHQASQLQVPGQFDYCEAKQILELTRDWNWTVDPKTRVPACHYQLLNLLEDVCRLPQVLEVAA